MDDFCDGKEERRKFVVSNNIVGLKSGVCDGVDRILEKGKEMLSGKFTNQSTLFAVLFLLCRCSVKTSFQFSKHISCPSTSITINKGNNNCSKSSALYPLIISRPFKSKFISPKISWLSPGSSKTKYINNSYELTPSTSSEMLYKLLIKRYWPHLTFKFKSNYLLFYEDFTCYKTKVSH